MNGQNTSSERWIAIPARMCIHAHRLRPTRPAGQTGQSGVHPQGYRTLRNGHRHHGLRTAPGRLRGDTGTALHSGTCGRRLGPSVGFLHTPRAAHEHSGPQTAAQHSAGQ